MLHIGDHYAQLGKDAGLVYNGSFCDQEFVAAYEKEFNHAPSNQSAGHFAGCQLSVDASGHDSEKQRETLLALKTKTVFGDVAVDERGCQIAHKFETSQWQDGKKGCGLAGRRGDGQGAAADGPELAAR
jgi:hypothetical protein